MNFQNLKEILKGQHRSLIAELCPGGKLIGVEWNASNINGGEGTSFSFNVDTGLWADFNPANRQSGNDLISLLAAQQNISQLEAAKKLAILVNYTDEKPTRNDRPNLISTRYGKPTSTHEWRDASNNLLGLTVRYEYTDDGVKQKKFSQWSIVDGQWTPKSIPNNRPLHNLKAIIDNPTYKILIVEGEKAMDAATQLFKQLQNDVIVTTWIGGSNAVKKTLWGHLAGRDVTIWPDNDDAGITAANDIVAIIQGYVKTLKVLEVQKIQQIPKKWDAADALNEAWDRKKLIDFVKLSSRSLKPFAAVEIVNPQSLQKPEQVIVPASTAALSLNTDNSIDHYEAAGLRSLWTELGLQMNSGGTQPNCNTLNVSKIMSEHPKYKGLLKYDEFTLKFYFDGKQIDAEDLEIRTLIEMQGYFGLAKINMTAIKESLKGVFKTNRFNSFKDYVRELTWDGTSRIDNFFINYYGAHDTQYTRDVSKNFWIGIVRRGFKPGTKFDNMVILEGVQGVRKSSSLQTLFNPWYDTVGDDPSNKDFYLKLHGNLVVEIEELDSFRKAESVTIKRMLSTTSDKFRKPYGANVSENPRTNIFVGTTNRKDYLSDSTGNRRFWPIDVQFVKFEELEKDRDQLFAEAYVREQTGEKHWEVDFTHLDEIYESRMNIDRDDSVDSDPWFGPVSEYASRVSVFNVYEFLIDPIKGFDMKPGMVGRKEKNRVTKIIKYLGFKSETKYSDDGKKYRAWFRQQPQLDLIPKKTVMNHATGLTKEI